MMRIPALVPTVAVALLVAGPAARASDHDADQQVVADPRGTVEVSNFSGRVEVTGWDKPQVSVHSVLPNSDTHVDVRTDHGRTTVAVRFPGSWNWGHGGDADLKIQIPRGSELDVTSVSADVTSSGVVGTQRLKTVSGRIKAELAQADVEAKTVSGDVTLKGDGKPAHLHVSTISGSIRIEHGAGDVEATTVSGDLNMQVDLGRSVRTRTTSGRTSIQGALAGSVDLDAQSVSGDIKLHAA